jgi:hypothetical protein
LTGLSLPIRFPPLPAYPLAVEGTEGLKLNLMRFKVVVSLDRMAEVYKMKIKPHLVQGCLFWVVALLMLAVVESKSMSENS